MATAVVTMSCRCGRTASVPCPELRDLQSAIGQIKGWWTDECGFVRCPECAAAPTEPSLEQGGLFA